MTQWQRNRNESEQSYGNVKELDEYRPIANDNEPYEKQPEGG